MAVNKPGVFGGLVNSINALGKPTTQTSSAFPPALTTLQPQQQLNQLAQINQALYQSNIAAFTSSYPKAYSGFASGTIAASDLVFNEGEKKEESLKDYMKRKLVWEDSTG